MEKQQSRMPAEERRAQILAKAKTVFAEMGYRGASTEELARASGITEPILYRHFGSKKQLYLAVLSLLTNQFMERFRNMVETRARDDLADSLANLMLDYRNAAMQDHDGIHLLLNALLEMDDPDVAEITNRDNREIYAFIFGLLEKAREQGILAPQLDLSAATWGYLSFLFALQYRAKVGIFDEFNEKTIIEINRLWLQSLRTR